MRKVKAIFASLLLLLSIGATSVNQANAQEEGWATYFVITLPGGEVIPDCNGRPDTCFVIVITPE